MPFLIYIRFVKLNTISCLLTWLPVSLQSHWRCHWTFGEASPVVKIWKTIPFSVQYRASLTPFSVNKSFLISKDNLIIRIVLNIEFQLRHSHYVIYFEGLNSLFTVVSMAGVRYSSIVRLERFWHSQTRNNFWSSPYILKLWGIALIFAIPPLVGFGEYKQDASEIWYVILLGRIVYL